MKAVILAAGKGTRMRELTDELPKPMLKVRGRPILEHILLGLIGAGIKEVFIVTGYRADVIEDYFGDGAKWGVRIAYGRQVVQDGTGRAPNIAREFVGTDTFLLTYGDILVKPETYQHMLRRFAEGDFSGLLTVTGSQDVTKGGINFFDDQFCLRKLLEKPSPQQLEELRQSGWLKPGQTAWYNAGIYIFKPVVFEFTERLEKSPRGEYELTDAINALVAAGHRIAGMEIEGRWVDVRDPEVLASLEKESHAPMTTFDNSMQSTITEPAITPDLVQKHNLTPDEYAKIQELLGREPSYTELGIFSVMWSEHCSYKNTRPLLKTFPTKSPKILVGAGEENAGIIDIGDGLAIAFKIESHNHPSAVEPFQGAATGVGGIIRDIFTMGARPVAAINSLRFGEISNPEVRRLFSGVVSGIAHYGNCFGIPTIAGEVCFDKTYEGNPLVNAFCLGVLRHEQIARGAAKGLGNPVFYVGPATGRDGLAGAAFASQDLTEESAEQQRGAVQVGDPFMEKLVCEACLELLATGAVAGIQDMGAAGLTCSTCETAARAGTGIEIELDKVPQRATHMTSYEIMLSESQERMLIIVKKGREEEVKRIFDKWDLPWAEIGFVTDTGRMVVKHHGRVVADIPARKLADEAPVYHRPAREPAYVSEVRAYRLNGLADTTEPMAHLKTLLAWPTIASKNWVYRQYDHMVRSNTLVAPGSDAAVLRIKADSLPESVDAPPTPDKYLAMTVDCNGVYVALDPYEGGKIAVTEACRNLACSGAVPLGVTDNLNMPSPLKPELFWQIQESVRGLADACRAFNAPVTGGNCSLYNQSPAGPIDPTPTVAVVGLIEKPEHITTQWFKEEGDAIVLLGAPADLADPLQGLGGSAYLQVVHQQKTGSPPRCDLDQARTLHSTLLGLIQSGLVRSAHDCSEGGLAVALAECCISQQAARETPRLIGARIDLSAFKDVRLDALLFGETQNRIILSCRVNDAVKVIERAKLLGVPAERIGTVGGDQLVIQSPSGEFSEAVTALHDGWWNSIARAMK